MATLITLVAITPVKRLYPHLGTIPDWAERQTLRLLWDRVWGLEERLRAAESNIKNMAAAVNTLNTRVDSVERLAKQAFALAQTPQTSPSIPGPGGLPPSSSGGSDCEDDGQANAGIADGYGSGHPGSAVPTSAYEAGRICKGTANEWPLLLAPTADQATRDAMMEELLLRMIWHLQQAGFTAGRQKNPSGVISDDKLTVQVDGEVRAYDMFTGVDYTQALPVHMNRVCPDDYQADGGIAD